ncbi:unnamed protein product [Hymenolepis diminuta]|uniref:DUF1593 domain-containing protein n=1 Tax=Hymenolepis diminuta TaxID=6216 RepID=A0A0R3SD21_HYMDI|nr:unnamed protein product [Hymenolepis diminuta]
MCGRTPLNFRVLYMRTKFPATVMVFGVVKEGGEEGAHHDSPIFSNASVDAYDKTPQTIAVKPLYIEA